MASPGGDPVARLFQFCLNSRTLQLATAEDEGASLKAFQQLVLASLSKEPAIAAPLAKIGWRTPRGFAKGHSVSPPMLQQLASDLTVYCPPPCVSPRERDAATKKIAACNMAFRQCLGKPLDSDLVLRHAKVHAAPPPLAPRPPARKVFDPGVGVPAKG
jgi:hypothetical protein